MHVPYTFDNTNSQACITQNMHNATQCRLHCLCHKLQKLKLNKNMDKRNSVSDLQIVSNTYQKLIFKTRYKPAQQFAFEIMFQRIFSQSNGYILKTNQCMNLLFINNYSLSWT